MPFVGLRDICLYEWLCALPTVEYKIKHLMRQQSYCDFFLAALKET